MSKLSITTIVLGFLTSSFAVNADDFRHSITAGYARSNVEYMDLTLDDDTGGFNLKYRFEFDDEYGLIISHTDTSYDDSATNGSVSISASLDYQSWLVGPTFRANEDFSAYLLLGMAEGKTHASISSYGSFGGSASDIAYGAGIQFNLMNNFVLDGSYEYTEIDSVEIGTWSVGVGLSF